MRERLAEIQSNQKLELDKKNKLYYDSPYSKKRGYKVVS